MRSLTHSFVIAALIFANIVMLAQTQRPAAGGVIQGIVQSGNTPLPGVMVTAANSVTNEKTGTSTDLNGRYQLKVPGAGVYRVETSMAAFAASMETTYVGDYAKIMATK